MRKTLTTAVAALSIAATFAGPVQANGLDRDDIGKLLFGLAAVAVIGAAIDQAQDDSRPQQTQSWSNLAQTEERRREAHRREARRTLPRDCLEGVETRFGTQRLFGQRCLERTYAFTAQLPRRCSVRIFTSDGPRNGYDPLCLREQGFQSARRH